MENEIWKNIVGYEGLYEVSNFGRVRSLDRTVIRKNGVIYSGKGKILNQYQATNGYMQVYLYKQGVRKSQLVHRLVMVSFIGVLENKEVNHINEIKTDNRLVNLEYVTRSENRIHNNLAKRIGLKNCKPVLMIDEKTGKILGKFQSVKDANQFVKSSYNGVGKVCSGKYKTFKGYIWKYA